MEEHHLQVPDTTHNFWHTTSILTSGAASFPILFYSYQLVQLYGWANALITLIIGNILLWLIGLGIISMGYRQRKNTLENARDYTGPVGGYLVGILLVLSTVAWFVWELNIATESVLKLVPLDQTDYMARFVQVGVLLGVLSTVFAMEGIVALRWLTFICFPLIIVAFIIASVLSPSIATPPNPGFTLAGLPLVIAANLAVTVDYPTFFRHSRTRLQSLISLTGIQIFKFLIAIFGVAIGGTLAPTSSLVFEGDFIGPMDLRIVLIALIILTYFCVNVANIYSASVGWEVIAPILAGRKEYLILGLGLTTIFVLVTRILSMDALIISTDAALSSLGVVLIVAFLLRLWSKQTPNRVDYINYLIAWLAGTTVGTLGDLEVFSTPIPTFLLSAASTILLLSLGWLLKLTFRRTTPT